MRSERAEENGKPRILIIEDNQDAADTLKLMLRMSGHEASVAYSGPEGLRKALVYQPTIVLCDLGLPGMDGYEIARMLRAESSMANMRIIAITGYGQPEDRKRALDAGFDEHFVKPVDPSRLLEHLGLQDRSNS